jgi:hypothetical protein
MCWVADEVRTADLGDARLNERMGKILQALGNKPSNSIPQAMSGWAETIAAYRFFDNKKATYERVLKPHYAATLERIKQQAVVLLPQDTTDFIHVVNKGSKGIGTLKKTEKDEIFFHPVLAITPDKLPLGTISVQLWKRSKQSIRAEHQNKPIEEKESYCWIEGYQAACDIQAQAPNTLIVSMGDRESDIYEFFLEMLEYVPAQRAAWIVRAAQDRCLVTEEDETARKLLEKVKKSPILGETKFTVPARNGKPARPVRQAVRAATVVLEPPERRAIKGFKLPTVTVNVIFAEEINPPENQEPVNWLLLTCLQIDSFEQVALILQWYMARWEIEIFFRVLKQGCKIEKLQFETEKRFAVCLAFYIIIAWRVLYVTMLGREYPNIDCEALFDKAEWQTLYIVEKREPPPEKPPQLSVIVLMLAKLGGFLGRKCDGFPGPQSIWIGLQRLRDFMWAIQSYQVATSLACARQRTGCV